MSTETKILIVVLALAAFELAGIILMLALAASASMADRVWKKDARARLKKQMDEKLAQAWTEPAAPVKQGRTGRWI